MKFNWKLIVALVAMVLLFACEKGESQESESNDNDDANRTENEKMDNNSSFDTIPPEDFSGALLKESYESIYAQTSEAFQSQIKMEELQNLAKDFNKNVDDYELVSELKVEGLMEYQWLSDNGTEGVRAYFADDNTIEGLQFLPVTSFQDSDDVWTENTYQMPFQGEWMTFWGGMNTLVNYHYAVESQRYAYDLLVMKDGVSYEGNASDNESYYVYGEAVLAPAEGEVVAIESNIEDNTPTLETNEDEPFGNHVILEHANNEYSVIGHMKKGSVTVKKGDIVDAGEELGKVGNSGNSSEPHIHFQVSNSPELEAASSIRIQLESGEDPVRGDAVIGFSKDE